MGRTSGRFLTFVVGLVLGLVLQASAWADTYALTEGSLRIYGNGRTSALEGHLEVSVLGSDPADPLQVVQVDSFSLSAGEQTFEPLGPLEYGGLPVIFPGSGRPLLPNVLVPPNILVSFSRMLLDGDEVEEMRLAAGGDPFDSNAAEVTFRFYEFVSDESEHDARGFLPMRFPGRNNDDDDDDDDDDYDTDDDHDDEDNEDNEDNEEDEDDGHAAGLPGEIEVEGQLFVWDGTYAILSALACREQSAVLPPGPPDGGGVIIRQDPGDLELGLPPQTRPRPPPIILPLPLPLPAAPPPLSSPPGGGAVVIIGGGDGGLEILSPPQSRPLLGAGRGVRFNSFGLIVRPYFVDSPVGISELVAPAAVPSLEHLQMEAPLGAEVSFDDAGVLTVTTLGDLFWTGALSDVPGLTHLEVNAANIHVAGELSLPPGVTISLVAVDQVVIGTPPGEGGPLPPPPGGLENGCLLAASLSERRAMGEFEFEAVRVRSVDVEVARGETRRGEGRGAWAVVFGSDSLDVRDIRRSSLEVRAESGPIEERRRGRRPRLQDWNNDGDRDLVVRLRSGRRGSPEMAGEVCLSARLRDGSRIRGCDALEPRAPRVRTSPRWGAARGVAGPRR